jgi:hypothetical protein
MTGVTLLRKTWLLLTGLALLAFAAACLIVGLDRADKIGSVVGAFAGVLGLAFSGVATPSAVRTVRASRTGTVSNHTGGSAVTGVDLASSADAGRVVADRTGDINGGGGDSVTGVRISNAPPP